MQSIKAQLQNRQYQQIWQKAEALQEAHKLLIFHLSPMVNPKKPPGNSQSPNTTSLQTTEVGDARNLKKFELEYGSEMLEVVKPVCVENQMKLPQLCLSTAICPRQVTYLLCQVGLKNLFYRSVTGLMKCK